MSREVRRWRVLGVTVLTFESDFTRDPEPPADNRPDVTTSGHSIGFVRDDLPTYHRPE